MRAFSAEDLPLNVSRETLQSNKFLKQLKSIILRRLLQLLARLQEEDTDKFDEFFKVYGNVLKLGAVEDVKNRDKLASLVKFTTTQRNNTSLDGYLENKKQGQKQVRLAVSQVCQTLMFACTTDLLLGRYGQV